MKYYIIAETRENHANLSNDKKVYNDYVSTQSMKDLSVACNENGYNCEFLGGMDSLIKLYNSKVNTEDCIFINYNYGLPSDFKRGQGPILLELMKVKYSGSDPLTSLMVNDKFFTKKILKNINILSPKSVLMVTDKDLKRIEEKALTLPIVVKPNCEGSSLGIDIDSLCYNMDSVKNKTISLFKKYKEVLVEEYIPGYEVTVWIIGNRDNYKLVQPLIISTNESYYFENKIFTMNDKAEHIRNYSLPNKIFPSSIIKKIIETAKSAFEELGMRDYGRIDLRINSDGIYFIEANALPIFSKTSEIGYITDLCGISYNDICKKLIQAIEERLMTKTD